jgi:hypothetical protein
MGGLTQIRYNVRDQRPGVFIESVAKDMVYAARSLRRIPGLLLAITITLALGIGANTAVYSIVHAMLIQPPPYRAPERWHLFTPTWLLVEYLAACCQARGCRFQKTRPHSRVSPQPAASVALTGQVIRSDAAGPSAGISSEVPASTWLKDGHSARRWTAVTGGLGRRELESVRAPFCGDSNAIGHELTLNGRPRFDGVLPPHFVWPS